MSTASPRPLAAGCCAGSLAGGPRDAAAGADLAARWVRDAGGGLARLDLMVPGITCADCMRRIERGLARHDGIHSARVNLSLRRVRVLFDPERITPRGILEALGTIGYEGRPYDAEAMAAVERDEVGRDLLARVGVAGFAAANVMLLSVAVWSGATGATRDLMHWISGAIALPAVVFAGMPFFRSALAALRHRRLNMDVPISLAVGLASALSLFETMESGEHAYFDAAIGLVFFLLVGRYLDHRTRARARGAAAELSALAARAATVIGPDGERRTMAVEELAPGDLVEVAAGERIPADGRVEAGTSDLDRSMVTGESVPEPVGRGDQVHAGMLNLSGPLRVRVTATGERTLLAEIARMIEAAERGRGRYDRWADRAARIYAPGVHLAALAAFAGWLWATGDGRTAVTTAISVLIITCPCALGLAVPAVHAVAGGRLFRRGIFLKDGGALERLAAIDTVVFDKTGTLTEGRPELVRGPGARAAAWGVAAALARVSRHPLARALAEAAERLGTEPAALEAVREVPGAGIEGLMGGARVRLGRAAWVGAPESGATAVWLRIGGSEPVEFAFEDRPRADAAEVVAALKARGVHVALFSGDAPGAVAALARRLGIEDARAAMTPADKLAALDALRAAGRRVLMVGDGINDAPALAAADVSMSPVAAADVSRAAASLVFTGEHLEPVLFAHRTARMARARAIENFAFAALYNMVAIPVAFAGLVTPLIAALAMSSSSIIVTLNALRLRAAR